MIKKLIKENFENFAYFYSNIGYRVFVVMLFSILIGILDGLGLSMFLPLLKMVNDASEVHPADLGKIGYLVEILQNAGISLNLLTILGFMVIFFLGKGVIQYFATIYKVDVQQWFIKKLRKKNIKGLNDLDYKYFVAADAGRIQNTLTGEVARVAMAYKNYFDTIQYAVLIVVYMTFAFFVNAQFAVLVTIGGYLSNFLFKKLYTQTKGVSRTLTTENNVFQRLIIQNVANFKYLKATAASDEYEPKLLNSVDQIEKNNRKIGQLDAVLTSAREPILILIVVAVIYIQTALLGSELGEILMSLIFFYRALTYLMQMQVRWNKFLGASGSLENVQLFQKELKENKERRGKQRLTDPVRQLELKNISFSYDNESILRNISLELRNQQTYAFVGESGSGKTTLVNILAGLLPLNSGAFLINGVDSGEIQIKDLQKKIGYITQDPVIFNDTLFNNVTFWSGRSAKTEARFWEVIEKAALQDFVNELPLKEDTILGNNGINLSGGQRQRVSIARELYKDVEILILDEATSALDSETEKEIQRNIDALKGNYTIFIVAHRISTIKNADEIIVMSNGKILESGSFYELVEKSTYFKRLVALQEL